jgi:hypothetical protein
MYLDVWLCPVNKFYSLPFSITNVSLVGSDLSIFRPGQSFHPRLYAKYTKYSPSIFGSCEFSQILCETNTVQMLRSLTVDLNSEES